MKRILLLLFSFIMLSCNTARKTNTNIENLEKNSQIKSQNNSGTKTESTSQTNVDLARLIDEFGLSIKGNGQQYSLNYGGLQFVGSADLELRKKTDSYRVIYVYHNWNIYHHWNITKKQEITKTNYKTKAKEVEAKKDNFWLYVLIFCSGMASMLALVLLWKKIKSYKITIMKTSQKGIDLIKEFEGLHDGDLKKIGLQPKMDPVGIWTEGYGRAMRDSKGNFLKGLSNRTIAENSETIHNEPEAEKALKEDLGVFERIVEQKLKVPINQNQFDALVSHTYNTGGSATLFDLINKKASKADIYNWFTTKYITSGGVKLPGLVRRRKAEADLYFS